MERLALPHCRIMIHQPQGGMEGQASEIVLEKDEIIRLRKLIGRFYVDLTGQSAATVHVILTVINFFLLVTLVSMGL